MKVKMLARHTAKTGRKLEPGLEYDFPPDYAQKLINHGLAILVIEPEPKVDVSPGFVDVMSRPQTRMPKIMGSKDIPVKRKTPAIPKSEDVDG